MERKANDIPLYAMRLEDLRPWHAVTATCFHCRHAANVPLRKLQRSKAGYVRLKELIPKLACTQCGNREGNSMGITMAGR